MNEVYLVCGVRSPFAKAGGPLKSIHATELGRHTLSEMLKKSGIPRSKGFEIIDEVIVGNTGTPADSANISRHIALRAGLSEKIPAYSVHRNCASALEAVAQGYTKIKSGEADIIVAGGTESMTQMPLIYNNKAVNFFNKLNRARSPVDKIKVLSKVPLPEFLKPRVAILEGLNDNFCNLNMGQTAEVLAKEFKISREEQDQFALESHHKYAKAQEAGYYKDEIAPFPLPPDYSTVLDKDVGPRANQSMEALSKLKPFFDKKFGSVTAGNACPITDGAVMLLLASKKGLEKWQSPESLAQITGYAFAGLDPSRMGLGPVFSTQKLLQKTEQSLNDFDLIEINEAFACQVMACQRAFESNDFCQEHFGSAALGKVEDSKLNVKGGAIALGHPVGATGARLLLTLALDMKRLQLKKGLATLCIGGGQGGAMSLERA